MVWKFDVTGSRSFCARTFLVSYAVLASGCIVEEVGTHTAFLKSAPLIVTDSSCTTTPESFDLRHDVYLASIAKPGNAGLQPGDYHIQISSPSGDILGRSPDAPIQVASDGLFASCIQIWPLVQRSTPDHLGNSVRGYMISPNPGDVYKVEISLDPTFPPQASFSETFQVTGQFQVDPSLPLPQPAVAGLDGGPSRPVASARGDSTVVGFVADEIIMRVLDQDDLVEVLDRYDGVILRDGTPFVVPELQVRPTSMESDGWYLIRINPQLSSLEDLTSNLVATSSADDFTFSSDEGARTFAAVIREQRAGHRVFPNIILVDDDVLEHPSADGSPINFENFSYMAADSGLRIGLEKAWDYLRYTNTAPSTNPWVRPILAIIDKGFDLDSEGIPNGGNIDFYPPLEKPLQFDLNDFDTFAGGPAISDSEIGKWHGQGSFGTAAAIPNNLFGGAGSGGPVVRPMLVRHDGTQYNVTRAMRSAWIHGANIMNISTHFSCGPFADICAGYAYICPEIPSPACAVDILAGALVGQPDVGEVVERFDQEALNARTFGVTVTASAGNGIKELGIDGYDTTFDFTFRPANARYVIGVGAIDNSGNAKDYSNYGLFTDIWAPTDIRATVSPFAADSRDDNNTGIDEVHIHGGTSAAAPYVAGVVGLMLAADGSLLPDEVLALLQNTSIGSTDPKVALRGYVNAFEVVRSIVPNDSPAISITSPTTGSTVSPKNITLIADANDPELGESLTGVEIRWSSTIDGELCVGTGFAALVCKPSLTSGTHIISATVVDPFGGRATAAIVLNVVNTGPAALIIAPTDGAVIDISQSLVLRGIGFDVEDGTLPDASTSWSSNIDGALATGREVVLPPGDLAAGTHTITLTVFDSSGATGADFIELTITDLGGLPSAHIISVVPATADAGAPVTFTGSGSDPEDGILSGSQIEWISDRDGLLGNGAILTVGLSGPECPASSHLHIITLRVTDTDGNFSEDTFTIRIGRIC